MTNGGDIGGDIRVRLRPENGRVETVEIVSTRPVQAARVFIGKPVDDMVASIGRVFSLCGKAQTVAALRASEAALGLEPAPGVEAARDLVRLAEMLTQTVMRLGLHWPRVLGLELRPELVRACLEAEARIEREVLGPGWRIPGAGVGKPADTVADALTRHIATLGEASNIEELETALAERDLQGFGALPAEMSPEAGALARNWTAPRVVEAREAHGAGLAARLAASRTDLDDLPLQMIAMLTNVRETPWRWSDGDSGQGAATVETARGPLTHRVTIEAGRVTGCATEAPTEANFTASGPVAMGLSDAPLDPVAAELHVLAIDPCVGCVVEVQDA